MQLNTPVKDPTWYSDIRQLFTKDDIDHMRSQGLDLSSYDVVKENAAAIYGQVASGNMPPGTPWPPAEVTTFLNWLSAGCPKGTNAPSVVSKEVGALTKAATAGRVRKDISTMSTEELATLQTAFEGILAKSPTDKQSFFYLAGLHWLPGPELYCQHHAPGYNPWHRAYLYAFENALRSIPGCENVTLPYWDITKPIPEVLKQAPYDKYTLPEDIGPDYKKGYTTQRYDDATIAKNLLTYDVVADLNRALTKTDWEDFHGYFAGAPYNTIIAAHDGGHTSTGPTMSEQSVAAFDPIFFFFHSNWDRLFWKWQKSMQATDLNGLLSTIDQKKDPLSYQIFTIEVLEKLPPFTDAAPKLTTVDIIDSVGTLDVDYIDPPELKSMAFTTKTQLVSSASESIKVDKDRVNVRVGGLNRLKIPGTFSVHLKKDGEIIASKAFFQPNDAEKCENCVTNAIVHFDFELPLAEVHDCKLEVQVEPKDKSLVGDSFPHKLMGNPTIEVQLLLKNE
ncbi:MAG: tyrosinase family protein [Akkermansiaceae bacterium]